MRKIFMILAILLVISLLYSCKGNVPEGDALGSESVATSSVKQTTATSNRISSSTLPPLNNDDGGDDEVGDGGASTDGIQSGDDKYFKHETYTGEYGSSLVVTEDTGFNGELNKSN